MDPAISQQQIQPEIPPNSRFAARRARFRFLKSAKVWPIVVLLALLIPATAYFLVKNQTSQTACTMEAKVCPDGTSVGRTGLKCEFVPCPTSNPTADWKTYSNASLSIKYPSDWNIQISDFLKGGLVLENPSGTIGITVAEDPYQKPYSLQGFDSEEDDQINNLLVKIDGINYNAQEHILFKRKAYVDLEIGRYQVLFGTGYPASDDMKTSISDYSAGKSTILQILSTLKFTEQTSGDSTLCIQVITPAKNNSTNECREFPTPCDVPQGWTKVSSCSN